MSFMLSVANQPIMLSVFMLSVIMLIVVAPTQMEVSNRVERTSFLQLQL